MEVFFLGIIVFLVFVATVSIIGAIVAYPVMLLWNGCLVDAVTGIHEITWLQSWGLIVLFSILFKSHAGSTKE